jgi:hypothetical protein
MLNLFQYPSTPAYAPLWIAASRFAPRDDASPFVIARSLGDEAIQ